MPATHEHRLRVLRHLEAQQAALAKPQRMTAAQRRVLGAAGPGGLLQREATIPESTWRRMLGCMWRAGWIEETAEGYRVAARAAAS